MSEIIFSKTNEGYTNLNANVTDNNYKSIEIKCLYNIERVRKNTHDPCLVIYTPIYGLDDKLFDLIDKGTITENHYLMYHLACTTASLIHNPDLSEIADYNVHFSTFPAPNSENIPNEILDTENLPFTDDFGKIMPNPCNLSIYLTIPLNEKTKNISIDDLSEIIFPFEPITFDYV